MSGQIFGNWIGGYMITRASGPMFYLMMSLVMLASVFGMWFVSVPLEKKRPLLFLDGPLQDEKELTLMENVKATFMLTFTKKMMILNLQLGWTGITIAFSQTMLVIIMVL